MLLARLYAHLGGEGFIVPLKPFRVPRQKIVRPAELQRAVRFAAHRLAAVRDATAQRLVLVLLDSDEDVACQLAPRLLAEAKTTAPDLDVACVLAVVEYETWFAASIETLTDFLDPSAAEPPSDDPEGSRHGKRWIETRFRRPKYSETIDQRRMTAAMDLRLCRRRCPSFDKLCREIEARISPV